METKVKKEICKMFIPLIGIWWVIARIIPDNDDDITFWDVSNYAILWIYSLVLYQGICWIGLKVFNMMYFFNYTLEEVFNK